MPIKMSLRERNRISAMRLVQHTAIDMFENQGFENVTIENLAEASGVSASTIYRHFGTKEFIVLWDERDVAIDEQLAARLALQSPIEAFRDAVVIGLAEREDREAFRRRLKLIYTQRSIWGMAAQQDREHRRELADTFAAVAGRELPTMRDEYTAAACLVALDIALDTWQRDDGRDDLAALIHEATTSAKELH